MTLQQHDNEIHAPQHRLPTRRSGPAGAIACDRARLAARRATTVRRQASRQTRAQQSATARSAATAPQQPPQLFEAHWTRELKMRPYEDNHVISLLGDARAGFSGQGELSADEIHLWLLEPPPADKSHPRSPLGLRAKSQIQPDRMLAIGQRADQLAATHREVAADWKHGFSKRRRSPRIGAMNGAPPMHRSQSGMTRHDRRRHQAPNNVADGARRRMDNVPQQRRCPVPNVASPNGRKGFMPAFGGPQRAARKTCPPQRYKSMASGSACNSSRTRCADDRGRSGRRRAGSSRRNSNTAARRPAAARQRRFAASRRGPANPTRA